MKSRAIILMPVLAGKEAVEAPVSAEEEQQSTLSSQTFWHKWFIVLKQILPTYIAMHIAIFIITCFAGLFINYDPSKDSNPLNTLLNRWNRYDVTYFESIASSGYHASQPARYAFFPFYSALIRIVTFVTHDTLISGLIISNMALLVLFMVLYQLGVEDFDRERAARAILYLSIFPTAFFLVIGYNESIFICLMLLSFYNARHGNWWLAGLFGCCASLTRSAGVIIALPFAYEYLRQHDFRLKNIRFDVVSIALVPVGLIIFSYYCYIHTGDFLAFSHAQSFWSRELKAPWIGIRDSIHYIRVSSGLLSFQSLRNMTDLIPDLFVLVLIVLSAVGPWRLPRSQWSYILYAASLYLLFQLVPVAATSSAGVFPLVSTSRFMLELSPAFLQLATLGKYRTVHINYLFISFTVFVFLAIQFTLGYWVL